MTIRNEVRTKGRPRSFDPEEALQQALLVFWEKGYEGASLSDLTEAMGINRPSLYATFGDKEALFRRVLDRYREGPASYMRESMAERTGRMAIERLLLRAVDFLSDRRNPKGCLLVQGALACGDESEPIRQELINLRAAGEAVVRRRLEKAKAEGELSGHVNPEDLSRFYVTVLQGLGVQAVGGATKAQLLRVVERAMKAWPQ